MNIEPGARFDSYEIVARLATGGMGEVWLARDVRLDRKAAVKVLPAHLTEDVDRVARFRQEARAASALNHPNVCTIYTLGTTYDGRVFIAMEYIDGRTLRERLDGEALPVRDATEIAAQIASGLAAAHGAGVIHRDIKPENVMIRSDGLVKVLDFGLAKLDPRIAPFEAGRSTRTELRTDGSVVGTMAYMSPEQASGRPLDARTDIFSLGAVLYEMVTGRQAFAGQSPAIVHDGILNRTPTAPIRLNPEVPPRLEDIVMKALEKDRDLRYQTAAELRTDLVRLKRDSDAPAAVAPRNNHTTSRVRSRVPAIIVGLGLLLTVLLGLTVLGWGSVRSLLFRSELQEIQLTTNSSENPVSAAAISPDGKSLAYADQTGLHLRQIDTGDTHTLAATDIGYINRVCWFPDGSKLIVSGTPAKGGQPAIWSLSIVGATPKKLRENAIQASASSDGSEIGFMDTDRTHVWLMGANGEEPRPVVTAGPGEMFYGTVYWANRLIYGRVRTFVEKSGSVEQQVSAESRDSAGHTSVLITDPGLRAAAYLPDGRVLYSLVTQPTLNRDASLWVAQADLQMGGLRGERHLRDWPGVSLWEFSASADGRRVVFVKTGNQQDVYVADLTPDGTPVNPRRFTLDDSNDTATNWSPDGKTILFHSDRNGTFDIFRQALDRPIPEAIVSGPGDEMGPTAVTPDGAWFYYIVKTKGWRLNPALGDAVWQTPAAGGPREKVADDSHPHWALCPRSTSAGCVLVEQDRTELVIYELDPLRGKGRVIARSAVTSDPYFPTDLSHDGSRLAILMTKERRIRVLSLNGEPPRDVAVTGWSLGFGAFYWSADDSGWYVSSQTSVDQGLAQATDLLRIGLDGTVKVVWHQSVRDSMSGIPSPDGRHIALTGASSVSNVWMLKNF